MPRPASFNTETFSPLYNIYILASTGSLGIDITNRASLHRVLAVGCDAGSTGAVGWNNSRCQPTPDSFCHRHRALHAGTRCRRHLMIFFAPTNRSFRCLRRLYIFHAFRGRFPTTNAHSRGDGMLMLARGAFEHGSGSGDKKMGDAQYSTLPEI